jgi:hypothetical protein
MEGRAMRPIVIAVAASFVLWAGCGKSGKKAPPAGGYIGGGVSTTKGGTAVSNAGVLLVNTNDMTVASGISMTDSQGRYRIDGVPPGSYTVVVLHDSLVVHEKSSPKALIESDKLTTYDIGMVPFEFAGVGGYHIEGTVTDAATADPIPGAYVGPALINRGEHDVYAQGFCPWSGVTDSLGHFSVPAIPYTLPKGSGLIPISVTKDGYEPFTLVGEGPSIPMVIPPLLPVPSEGKTLEVGVTMRPLASDGTGPHGTGAIKGHLTSFGNSLGGVLVGVSLAYVSEPDTLRLPPASHVPVPQKVVRTNGRGDFEVTGLTPGYYWVDPAFPQDDGYVMSSNLGPFSGQCMVEANATCDLGTLQVGRAISPIEPGNRAAVQDTTPELRWTAIPDHPGMVFVGYNVQYGTGYVMDNQATNLTEPRWQVPDSKAFSVGDVVRWTAIARAYNPAIEDTVAIGEFEWPATFRVVTVGE